MVKELSREERIKLKGRELSNYWAGVILEQTADELEEIIEDEDLSRTEKEKLGKEMLEGLFIHMAGDSGHKGIGERLIRLYKKLR